MPPQPPKTLLIYPPLDTPARAPLALAEAAGDLTRSGAGWDVWDANLEFVRDHLLSPSRLEAAWQRVRMRLPKGPPGSGAVWPQHLVAALEDPARRGAWFDSAPMDVTRFRSESFYDPMVFGAASMRLAAAAVVIRMDWQLAAATADRVPFELPQDLTPAHIAAPLDAFFEPIAADRLAQSDCQRVILVTNSRQQAAAADRLAARIRRLRPDLAVAIRQAAVGPLGRGDRRLPNYSGIHVHAYLAPEPVLAYPADSGPKAGQPDAGARMDRWLRRSGGVCGLIAGAVSAPPAPGGGGPAQTARPRETGRTGGRIPWPLNLADVHLSAGPPAYGSTRPLRGRPLAQWLTDSAHRLLFLRRHGRKNLSRWRVDGDNAGVYRLGTSLRFVYRPPEAIPADTFEEICRMVEAGGTVDMRHVRRNLRHAFLIAYVLEGGNVVGNSSLKRPRPEYIAAVGRRTDLDLRGCLERGYTSVRPEYRGLGIGTRLLSGLTRRAGGRRLFSIIAEDNTATQTIARRNRTRKVVSFYSQKAGKPVGLWMPEEQAP
jgi:GNAT superfamily N-acetyltransferase